MLAFPAPGYAPLLIALWLDETIYAPLFSALAFPDPTGYRP